MLLVRLAETSEALVAMRSRNGKVGLLAACLREAAPDEVPLVVAYLSADLPQRRTGLGMAALRDLPAPAEEPSLTLAEVDAMFSAVAACAGQGSATRRRDLFAAVMRRATEREQHLLAGLVMGELRHGALEGVMLDAVARAGEAPLSDVRRAVMMRGALAPVAVAVLTEGPKALDEFRLRVGRPVQPMLAQSADSVEAALERTGRAAVEEKLDGIRVQVHREDADVGVFTRSLDDITSRVPEIVRAVLDLPASSVVLDGEAIALRPDGRPRPFQETASRIGRSTDVGAAEAGVPLQLFCFDLLHLDGDDLMRLPTADRQTRLDALLPAALRIPRVVTDSSRQAAQFLAGSLARGHEGVVVKSLTAPYEAGRRGTGWVKVKPRHTLDLVVLAAEWGSGRRRGTLSNLHLGARSTDGGFVMLGKTFKGLTDAMLAWQTEKLLELAVERGDWVVRVRPELVVEVAFDGVQTSSRYPGGMALRFARVVRHRPDKSARQADTVEAVRAVHEGRREQ